MHPYTFSEDVFYLCIVSRDAQKAGANIPVCTKYSKTSMARTPLGP